MNSTEPRLHQPALALASIGSDLTPGHRPFFVTTAMAAGALALGCIAWPAAAWLPLPMLPLHARCLGVLYGTLAFMVARAAMADDIAAVRVPLAVVATAAAGLAWAFTDPAVGAAWSWLHALAAALALLLLRSDRTLKAPAERLHRPLASSATVAALVAVLLLLWPAPGVAWWPWPLPSRLAAVYASLAASVAVLATTLARERRRDARRIGLQTLLLLATGVLLASAWHWRVLVPGGLATAVWITAWLLIAAVALRRLQR